MRQCVSKSSLFRHTSFHLNARVKSIVILFFLLISILITRLFSYLLFHMLAELTSIVIGICVFIIAWNSASLHENGFLLIIGVGSMCVAVVDTIHALAYKGMSIFPGDNANLPTQLWVIARYLQSLTFLIAPLFLNRKVQRKVPFIIYSALTIILLASIFIWNIFPSAYIEGQGLTPFKVGSEYAIIFVLLIAIVLLWRRRDMLAPSVFYGVIESLVASIAAEFSFTLYFGVTDTANLIGHLFKIIAFYALYRALVEVAFTRPYDLLLRQLKQSEEVERTGRYLAETELRASEERYRGLVNYALVGVYQTSREGKILFANSELLRLLHFDSEKGLINGSVIDRYKNPQDRVRLMEILERDHNCRDFETDLLTRDGQTCHVILSARLQDGTISGMILDISERKRAEERVQRQVVQLGALRTIDLAIINSADLHFSLKIIVEQAAKLLRVDAISILLMNPYLHTLECAESCGFQKKMSTFPSLRLGEGFAGRAALERRMVSIENIADSKNEIRYKQLFEDEGFVSVYALPLVIKGQLRGVFEIFNRTHLHRDQSWLDFIETFAGQIAIAIDNATLFEGLQKSNIELVLAYDTTLEGWSHALDLRDKETEGHTSRVTDMTVRLARAAGISEEELVQVRRGALLHDIGKMGIPDAILLKPDKLTDVEWVEMRKHPQYAYELLTPIAYLRSAIDIPFCHHEKWDGTGYPRGLKGEQIPLAARLFAVVDVWDALRSDRPYRKGWSDEKVYEYIKSLANTHFDPKAVELFFRVLSEESLQEGMSQPSTASYN